MNASVRPSTSVKRPWAVIDGGKLVELHATEEAAQQGADRINRTCGVCGTHGGLHAADCALGSLERDHDFGNDYDTDEEEL